MSLCDRIWDHEWLDRGDLRPEEVHANLRDLEFINRWLGGARSILTHVSKVMDAAPAGAPFRILDVACGGGDLLRLAVKTARRMRRPVMGIGVDANDRVLAHAQAGSVGFPELRWVRADARSLPFAAESFDLVMSSCFLHHLRTGEAASLLAQAATLGRTIVAGDLARSGTGATAFRLFCWLAGMHPVTRHDGLLSLCRAFAPEELAQIARDAGLAKWQLYRSPFHRATIVGQSE